MIQHDKLYIGGQWVPSVGQESPSTVTSPATEETIATVVRGTADDVNRAVQAARDAFDGWSSRPVAERAAFLMKIHEGLKARAADIAQAITSEMGMPLKQSLRIQAGSPIAAFKLYAGLVDKFHFEEEVGNSLVVREAIGVVAAITPWNYPLHQIAAKVAAALAAGCTVVLKPSEVAPLDAFILAEVIHDSGLPAGVFNLVTGRGTVVGEAMVSHPDVDMVSFTGSTRAGRRISELASATIKRVALELGGKSASIILDDADFPTAVRGSVGACFLNAGQTCTAHTRMLVPESRYEEAAQLAVAATEAYRVGDPFEETSTMGPVASKAQQKTVNEYIEIGLSEGAELLTGGLGAPEGLQSRGYYVRPTVFGRVKPESRLAQEEVFGPVLSIITYKDEADAIRIANNTQYGLSGGVWSSSDARAQQVARKMRTGQVDINGGTFNMLAPFGGYKQSGNGREFGKYGLEDFLELKSFQFKRA
ncbi:aldehyde dehydrogenase family protein [Rhizobacter sp. LjRoot28]|uniref:aldehyde dehydrogenase family protein n=1 Tax=Rhizobacter sp. LjRoot28 TaxID=3342309 RepID=UPI003ECF036C